MNQFLRMRIRLYPTLTVELCKETAGNRHMQGYNRRGKRVPMQAAAATSRQDWNIPHLQTGILAKLNTQITPSMWTETNYGAAPAAVHESEDAGKDMAARSSPHHGIQSPNTCRRKKKGIVTLIQRLGNRNAWFAKYLWG